VIRAYRIIRGVQLGGVWSFVEADGAREVGRVEVDGDVPYRDRNPLRIARERFGEGPFAAEEVPALPANPCADDGCPGCRACEVAWPAEVLAAIGSRP
jgi:hypothetical protein